MIKRQGRRQHAPSRGSSRVPSEGASRYRVQAARRHTLKDEVYAQVCTALMSGEFAPGDRLTVRQIAELTGTSMMPVREAFRRLVSEGALEATAAGGTRVPAVDGERLGELLMLRTALEGLAARRAAEYMSDADLDLLGGLNDAVLDAIRRRDAQAEARANEQFHFAVYRAANAPELLRIIESLWLRMGPILRNLLRDYNQSTASRQRRRPAHHGSLIDALKRRDGHAAEQALRRDLEDAAEFYLERLRRTPRARRSD